MGLMDILNQYVGQQSGPAGPAAVEHFGQVAQQAPQSTVSQGLTEAFRSDQTPPFGEMVARLFGNSNPQQRAGLLTQLTSGFGLGSVGAGTAGAGPLGDLMRQLGGGGSTVTAEQAAAVTPDQVQQAATHAEQQSPGIVERVSDFYAQHPTLVQTLGGAALTIALAKMAQR
jgi:hypothetical protein